MYLWHGGEQVQQRSDGIAVSCGKEETVVEADGREEIGVGPTNGHRDRKRPPDTGPDC